MTIEVFERPTTSWNVLERIKVLAREDPKRICMNFELCRRTYSEAPDEGLGYPRCGTIGCIGGLASLQLRMVESDDGEMPSLYHTGNRMGLDWETQATPLFYPTERADGISWSDSTGIQTPEYAERVIAHIERFQQKHEQHVCQIGPATAAE